jgi:transcription antitermination factor NusG
MSALSELGCCAGRDKKWLGYPTHCKRQGEATCQRRSIGSRDGTKDILPVMNEKDFPEDFRMPKWYVLFVRSNQERRVAYGLAKRGLEHFLPCYSSVRQWKDRRVRLEMPLFPGYLFVRMPLLERMRALVVPNVVSLVGRKDSPAVITEDEITWIWSGATHGQAEPHQHLQAGQLVIIACGPMAGMKGILLRKQNNTRVVVSIASIARAFAVDVDGACVEPLGAAPGEHSSGC